MTPGNILETVRVCQRVAEGLGSLERQTPSAGRPSSGAPRILVTGGTGFLGREILRQMAEQGVPVRSASRRPPPPWDTLAAVDYRVADLAEGLTPELLVGIEAVIHCAAETAGGWEAHERNSTGATDKLLRAAAKAGVSRVVYISSIAVLTGPDPLTEMSPLHDGRGAGPYVWGKATAERTARELAAELGLRVTFLRPGAIVDWRQLDPPGKLGKRLGNLFVAVGGGKDTLGVVDIQDVARVAIWTALNADRAPETLNVLDPDLPTKSQLVKHLRRANPGLRVVWLPRGILWPLSWLAMGLQKVVRPRSPAINVGKVFANRRYDPEGALRLRAAMAGSRREAQPPVGSKQVSLSPAGEE